MATEKPANQDLSQQVSPPFLTAQMEEIYEGYMDSMLTLMGRTVRIWLPPAQTAPTSNPDQLNPWTNHMDPRLGGVDQESGRSVEPIYADYTALIVHGPKPVTNDRPFELEQGEVQITTVIGSLQDIEDAIELEIDGIKYDRKTKDERRVGFQTPKYLISFWQRKA